MSLLIALAGLLTSADAVVVPATQSDVAAGRDGPALATADMVANILAYSRWPDARSTVRLCIVGSSPMTARIAPRTLIDGRTMTVGMLNPSQVQQDGCDALYMARIAPAELARIAQLNAGRARLTMTDSDPQCRNGIMFCLRLVPGGLSFDLDIDAVSRSRVRVDPRVLSLGRGSGDRP